MVQIYIRRIMILKNMTIDEVPPRWRDSVESEILRLYSETEK